MRGRPVRGAAFNEFDLATELWTIPAERIRNEIAERLEKLHLDRQRKAGSE